MDRKVQEPVKLFQYNTLGALMAGLYGGTMTVGELLEHGDLGLGTLDSIDGELIVLDGKAYQAKGSGEQPEIVEVAPDALIPYAAVVPHQAEVIFRQRFEMTDKELEKRIESYYDGENGFWTPEIFHGVSVAGYHLHFISDDLTFGGHMMDFVIKEGIIEVGPVDQLDQRFPVQDRQYLFAKFNVDEMKKDIDKSE